MFDHIVYNNYDEKSEKKILELVKVILDEKIEKDIKNG